MIWDALLEFLIRLSFGLCLGMLCVPRTLVPAGFYRVHLWVLLGLYTLAALFATNQPDSPTRPMLFWLSVTAAGVSYVGAVIWLYERTRAGVIALACLAAIGLATVWQLALAKSAASTGPSLGWALADGLSASALLGFTMAAMLLGHWYLNSPGMQLRPLRRLIVLGGVSVAPPGIAGGERPGVLAEHRIPPLVCVLGDAGPTLVGGDSGDCGA